MKRRNLHDYLEARFNTRGWCSVDGEGDLAGGDGGGTAPDGGGADLGGTGGEPADNGGTPGEGTPPAEGGAPSKRSVIDGEGGDNPAPKPGAFGEDWRTALIKSSGLPEDQHESISKQLARMADPGQLLKSYKEMEAAHKAKGSGAPKLPENPTEEQLAEYREAVGIPEKAEAYFDGLPEGIALGEADKAAAESFFNYAHSTNLFKQEHINATMDWYQKHTEAQRIAAEDLNSQMREQADDAVRKEWGGEYRANINMIKALTGTMSQEAQDALFNATDDRGVSIFNDPNVLRDFARLAREINPTGVLIDGHIPADAQSVEDEIAELEKQMGTREWAKDGKKQERYMQLIAFRDKHK